MGTTRYHGRVAGRVKCPVAACITGLRFSNRCHCERTTTGQTRFNFLLIPDSCYSAFASVSHLRHIVAVAQWILGSVASVVSRHASNMRSYGTPSALSRATI